MDSVVSDRKCQVKKGVIRNPNTTNLNCSQRLVHIMLTLDTSLISELAQRDFRIEATDCESFTAFGCETKAFYAKISR